MVGHSLFSAISANDGNEGLRLGTVPDRGVSRAVGGARPVIGVSGACAGSASVRAMFDLLAAVGAAPLLFVDHGKRAPTRDIIAIDGLVVMGNDFSVNPALYGHKPHPAARSELSDPAALCRAVYETEMIRLALDSGMPLVGICGGMQRLNVIRGGDLIQHLPDLLGHDRHEQRRRRIPASQSVADIAVIPGGLLHRALGFPEKKIPENSMHRQAVGRVGGGLQVAAYVEERSASGGSSVRVVEALEPDPAGSFAGRFILGLQWHPEFQASFTGGKIASGITKAAADFAFRSFAGRAAGELHALCDID